MFSWAFCLWSLVVLVHLVGAKHLSSLLANMVVCYCFMGGGRSFQTPVINFHCMDFYYPQHSKKHGWASCVQFFPITPATDPRQAGECNMSQISFVHTVSLHGSWETLSLGNLLIYSKQSSSLLFVPVWNITASLKPACCRQNPEKWPEESVVRDLNSQKDVRGPWRTVSSKHLSYFTCVLILPWETSATAPLDGVIHHLGIYWMANDNQ